MKTKEDIKIGDEDVAIYVYSNPMSHADWHEAEAVGFVRAVYVHLGPDYWDDELIFCRPRHVEKVAVEYREY
ncbi:MAG: hypothetical protein IID41_00570 [Planctomycetes bacterium]|nr:hypothetical protein [Planctomycetota bacterium]